MTDWTLARCYERPIKGWFPERTSKERSGSGLNAAERRAKHLCVTCPLREACLRACYRRIPPRAVRDEEGEIVRYEPARTMEEWGIWGGTLERERRSFKHLESCRHHAHCLIAQTRGAGCYPLEDRIASLLGWMKEQAAQEGLAPEEEVA